MKAFATALLLTAAAARGGSGGLKQGNKNPSLGATHGYGYNVGNDYLHGDSHGHVLGHQSAYELESGYGPAVTGDAYTAANTHEHLYGYDAVPAMDDDEFDAAEQAI